MSQKLSTKGQLPNLFSALAVKFTHSISSLLNRKKDAPASPHDFEKKVALNELQKNNSSLRHRTETQETFDPTAKRKKSSELPIAGDHPLNVLVAEDNPANQKVIEIMLRKLGYLPSTTIVANGQEALIEIRKNSFDVVFMDLIMPVLNGYDTTEEIRKLLPEDMRPRIIALTASAFNTDREKAKEAGMDDFITKPIRYVELKQVLLESPSKQIQSCS